MLSTVTGVSLLPLVLQEAVGFSWKEPAVRAGGELPVMGCAPGVGSWYWAIPAQWAVSWGTEAPSGLGVQGTTEQLRGMGPLGVGASVGVRLTCLDQVGFAMTENKQ